MPESSVTSVEQLPQAVVVHVLVRNLGKIEMDGLCAEVDKAQAAAPSLPFVLDMAKVEFAGSLAMGVLVGLNQEFRTRGQRLVFAGLQAAVGQSFNITRINRIVEIVQDVPTALRGLGG